MRTLSYLFTAVLISFSSCHDIIDIPEESTNIKSITTKSFDNYTDDEAIKQIIDMPVNIIARNYNGPQFLSANMHVNNPRLVGTRDKEENTGYQQWIIKDNIPPVMDTKKNILCNNRYAICLVATFPGSMGVCKYLNGVGEMATYDPDDNWYDISFIFFKVNNTENLYYICNSPRGYSEYFYSYDYLMSNRLLIYCDGPLNRLRKDVSSFLKNDSQSQWEIRPIETFQIENIEYFMNAEDIIEQIPDFITHAYVNNNTSVTQSMNMTFSDKATEQSKFSETEGLSVTVSSSTSIGIPNIIGGKLDMTSVSSKSWSFENSETREDSRTYSFPIIVPPYTRVDAQASVLRYKAKVTYRVTLKGIQSKKIIKLIGSWQGVKASTISYTLTEGPLNKIVKTFVGPLTEAVDLTDGKK